MTSLSGFLSSIFAQFFMTVKKLHLNFVIFLSLLDLQNSGRITSAKNVELKLYLNKDCEFTVNLVPMYLTFFYLVYSKILYILKI